MVQTHDRGRSWRQRAFARRGQRAVVVGWASARIPRGEKRGCRPGRNAVGGGRPGLVQGSKVHLVGPVDSRSERGKIRGSNNPPVTDKPTNLSDLRDLSGGQHLNDHWDLDHPFERLLVDTAVVPDPDAVSGINPRIWSGEMRRVVTGVPGKTGRRLHARPRDQRVPLGDADHLPERHHEHRRSDRLAGRIWTPPDCRASSW